MLRRRTVPLSFLFSRCKFYSTRAMPILDHQQPATIFANNNGHAAKTSVINKNSSLSPAVKTLATSPYYNQGNLQSCCLFFYSFIALIANGGA